MTKDFKRTITQMVQNENIFLREINSEGRFTKQKFGLWADVLPEVNHYRLHTGGTS